MGTRLHSERNQSATSELPSKVLDWKREAPRVKQGLSRILGPLEVVGDEGPIPLGGPKQRATLAILLLSVNRIVSVERLADDLYAGAPPVTAVTQVQRQVSELRKVLGADCGIETRSPGYVIQLAPGQLDLDRFERRTEEAGKALAQGDARRASDLLSEALALWRGFPLDDLAFEPFAQLATARLDEIRLAAVEQRVNAELALGRHRELIAELEALVAQHPLRERFRAQLMIALYRSGRQAEALEAFRSGREAMVEGFGIEPGSALRELERAILNHDASLEAGQTSRSVETPVRAVLVLPFAEDAVDLLLSVAEPLATVPGRELIIVQPVADESELRRVASGPNARRAALEVSARSAAFTSETPAEDALRFAASNDVDLLLVDAPAGFDGQALPSELAAMLKGSPADVGLLGMPMRWEAEGLGHVRRALVQAAKPATLLVHAGTRPGGLAPGETRTRFSWSIEGRSA